MKDTERKDAITSLHTSYRNAEYSDLKIICGTSEYKVHKLVVCSQSKFLANAVTLDGKESTIELKDELTGLADLLIQYFYEGEYTPLFADVKSATSALAVDEEHLKKLRIERPGYSYRFPHTCFPDGFRCNTCEHHLQYNQSHEFYCTSCIPPDAIRISRTPGHEPHYILRHAVMFYIGDKYDVIGLKNLAAEKFIAACENNWFEEQFVNACRFVFATPVPGDEVPKDKILSTICQHFEIVKKPSMEAFLRDYELGYDALTRKAGEINNVLLDHMCKGSNGNASKGDN